MNNTNESLSISGQLSSHDLYASGGLYTVSKPITRPNLTFHFGQDKKATVTLNLETGEVIIEDGLGLPDAAKAFWEAVRVSMMQDYVFLPADEYRQLVAKANKGE